MFIPIMIVFYKIFFSLKFDLLNLKAGVATRQHQKTDANYKYY